MESLQIRTGDIKLQILDDLGNERGIFTFNPEDVSSAKKLLEFREELSTKNAELESKIDEASTAEDQISVMNEAVLYFRDRIDNCFGAGTSELLFGNTNTLSMFYDFIEGITPYYVKASEKRKAKYQKMKK